jgi:hypothetical protein
MDGPARQQAAEILSLLNVTRGMASGTDQPQLAPPANAAPPASDAEAPTNAPQADQDTALKSAGFPRNPARVMLTGRSILGVMTSLAQEVDVPPEHLRQGLAYQTLQRDGKPFDWNEISRDMFHVRSSRTGARRWNRNRPGALRALAGSGRETAVLSPGRA